MLEGFRIGAILLMGGEGHRFKSALPKQFHFLGEKRIFQYSLETFLASGLFDEVILVCHPGWLEIAREQESSITHLVPAGKTRQSSSYAGIKGFKTPPDIVLIHDAVRPFVSQFILEQNVRQAIIHGAANTCIPSTDTLVYAPTKQNISIIPKREDYLRGQTPQTFRIDWAMQAHEKAIAEGVENATDDCKLILDLGHPIQIVMGDEQNLKITSELDLFIAEHFLSSFICRLKKSRQDYIKTI